MSSGIFERELRDTKRPLSIMRARGRPTLFLRAPFSSGMRRSSRETRRRRFVFVAELFLRVQPAGLFADAFLPAYGRLRKRDPREIFPPV